ncbi:ADP-ribose pyrophosphatase [Streptomyces sp. WMMB 714]|uniref:NUDIX hydrolase n=1 Tax=Streptomyces sp. WMMB 714 TaxID=1286822 RepID=UPI0006979A51|nr:NUDIX domain-containing protein [Streptomyces sp. WMMB 714]SCK55183.1 ADP-ribose pyrophosphatase [Streptomyces sp. WMMB 714]
MTDAREVPLVTGPRRMALLSFDEAAELPESAGYEDVPTGYVLVVLWHEGRVLMVYERERACWELPGGGIEPQETPRAAAVRELREETGQRVDEAELRFVGHTRTAVGEAQRVLGGAVFAAEVREPHPFTANDEVSAVHWRAGTEPLPGGGLVQTVDEYIVELCREKRAR